MDRDFIPAGQSYVESDTGELKRDWEKGIQAISTERSQIAAGSIGGETVRLSNATFEIKTKKAVVAIQSLDGKPIRKSGRIFITLMARSQPAPANKTTMLSEPVTGRVSFAAPMGLKVYPVVGRGAFDKPLEVTYAGGRYEVNFSSSATHWFIVR